MIRLLAIGLCVMDNYVDFNTMYPGGNELNVAVYAKRLGSESGFIGTFGTDNAASLIRSVLDSEGIDYRRCRTVDGETGAGYVRLINNDRVFVGHNNGGVTGTHPLSLEPKDIDYIQHFDLITSSLYSRIPLEQMLRICDCGLPVAYDFSENWNEENLISLAPHITYGFFSCANKEEKDIKELLLRAHQLGCKWCIGTRGEDGSILFDGINWLYQDATKANVCDTMGAGDSFIAAFVLSHQSACLAGKDEITALKTALQAGADFAAKICERKGAIGYEFSSESK